MPNRGLSPEGDTLASLLQVHVFRPPGFYCSLGPSPVVDTTGTAMPPSGLRMELLTSDIRAERDYSSKSLRRRLVFSMACLLRQSAIFP